MKTIAKPEAIITTSLLLLIAAITLVLLLSGCSYERIEGNNNFTSETRSSEPFDELISSGSFDVQLINDTITSVEVKAESNIFPYLYTISDGATLRIGYKNGYNIHENYPVKVILHTPHARIIRLQGSGKVECSRFEEQDVQLFLSGSGDIDCDYDATNLNAEISGSGNIHLAGRAVSSSFVISGSGTIRSLDMEQDTCDARISGSGDVYSDVNDQLNVHISGSGCVYYTGDPQIHSSISGSGKVRKY